MFTIGTMTISGNSPAEAEFFTLVLLIVLGSWLVFLGYLFENIFYSTRNNS